MVATIHMGSACQRCYDRVSLLKFYIGPQGPNNGVLPGGLALVPGPAGGEGCSAEGGCASCPFMKMNTLSALLHVAHRINTPGEALLEQYRPRAYTEVMLCVLVGFTGLSRWLLPARQCEGAGLCFLTCAAEMQVALTMLQQPAMLL